MLPGGAGPLKQKRSTGREQGSVAPVRNPAVVGASERGSNRTEDGFVDHLSASNQRSAAGCLRKTREIDEARWKP